METKFGVHLRSARLSGDTRSGDVHSTNRSVYISKPVEDLKEMFEKHDISSELSTTQTSTSSGAFGLEKGVTQTSTVTKSTKLEGGTSSETSTKLSEGIKFKSSSSSKPGQFGPKGWTHIKESSSVAVSDSLKSVTPSTDESVPAIAKAKVFGAGTQIFTATVENKTNKASNGGLQGLEAVELDKKAATNQLVTGLALLRIRPGLGKSDDGRKIIHSKSASNSSTDSADFKTENSVAQETKSLFSTSSHSSEKSQLDKKNLLDQNKKLNLNQEGLAKTLNVDGVSTSQKKVHDATFQSKTFTKNDVLTNRVCRPVMRASSSCSSSGGTSPRNEMEQINNTTPKGLDSKSENRSSPTTHGDGNSNKPETRVSTELKKQSQALERRRSAAEIHGKEKHAHNRQISDDSPNSDSDHRPNSNFTSKSKFKWVEKGRLSLEEFKEQQKLKSTQKESTVENAQSRMSSASPDGNVLQRHKNDPLVAGLISQDASSISRLGSRKLGTINFRNIKEGFEKVAHSVQEDNSERKPQIELRITKNLLERKKSLETLEVSVRSQTSASLPSVLRSSLDKGRVLERVKSLNEFDATSRTPPIIRTQRPSTSSSQNNQQEEQPSSDDYDNMDAFKPSKMKIPGYVVTVCDDGQSNEGDISSEAGEGLYETITGDKDDSGIHSGNQAICKRSPGVRRRRKPSRETDVSQHESSDSVSEVTHEPSGTDGDIDSDSDSSGNSGIYEPVDHLGLSPQCDSLEEVEPPPPIPVRKQVTKKKKKTGDKTSGEKTFKAKIKKLYKGNKNSASTETDSALLSLTHQALATAVPSSSGVLTLIGGKIKNFKKTKSTNFSKSFDVNPRVVMDLPRNLSESDLMPKELDTSGSSTENELDLHCRSRDNDADTTMVPPDLESPKLPTTPPPLPPRDHGMYHRVHSGESFTVPKTQSHDGNESPPLPPRNPRASKNNLNLDMVVPIIPGMKAPTEEQKKRFFPPTKDSYLYGQELHSASEDSESDYLEPSPSQHSSIDKVDSYVSVDPPYMDATELEYSLAHEIQRELHDRNSSAYIKPEDIYSLPSQKNETFISSPFPQLLQYKSPNDEDDLYIELSDDQVYGRVGNRYKSKLESESLYQFYNKDKIVRASRRKTVYVSSDESGIQYILASIGKHTASEI